MNFTAVEGALKVMDFMRPSVPREGHLYSVTAVIENPAKRFELNRSSRIAIAHAALQAILVSQNHGSLIILIRLPHVSIALLQQRCLVGVQDIHNIAQLLDGLQRRIVTLITF